jgi:hypothetical protein
VIDEKPLADPRAGVNLDPRDPSPEVRNEARQPLETAIPEPVREAVDEHRVEARIARHDFPRRARRRVALEYHRYFFFQTRKHGRRTAMKADYFTQLRRPRQPQTDSVGL